jgi:hypothetical protein
MKMRDWIVHRIAFTLAECCAVPRHSISEAVLAHSKGDDHTFLRPVECDAAQLRGQGPGYQFATETFEH